MIVAFWLCGTIAAILHTVFAEGENTCL
jgi:hypothetical protein